MIKKIIATILGMLAALGITLISLNAMGWLGLIVIALFVIGVGSALYFADICLEEFRREK